MTVHSQSTTTAAQAIQPQAVQRYAKLGTKLAFVALVTSLSACVIVPVGPRHHGYYSGQVVAQPGPVVVTQPPVVVQPAVRYGYPRYYRY